MTAAFRTGWEAAQATVEVSESGHVVVLSNQGQTSQLGQLLQPHWRKEPTFHWFLPEDLSTESPRSVRLISLQGAHSEVVQLRDVLLLWDGPKLSHVMMRAAWVSDRCRLCP